MNSFSIYFSATLLLLLLAACSQESQENDNSRKEQPDTLIVADAWARPAAKGTNSAAYMTIYNHTSRADTLKTISGYAVTMAEVHESYEEDGMTGMRPAGELLIKAGSRLELKPGGFHVMLMQVKRQLISGDSLQLALHFATSGTHELTIPIR